MEGSDLHGCLHDILGLHFAGGLLAGTLLTPHTAVFWEMGTFR